MTSKIHPSNDPNYLGEIAISRPNGDHPNLDLNVVRAGKFLRFLDDNGNAFPLSPRDRKESTAVMQDDSQERLDVLRAALTANGWVNVIERP